MVVLKESVGDFEPISEGIHKGVCFASIDLGTQKVEFQGEIKYQRKIRLSFESHDQMRDDGQPMVISKDFTYSLFQNAALVKTLNPWVKDELKDGFDTDDLVSRPCQFLVEHEQSHEGRIYAKLTKVMPVGSAQVKHLHNNPVKFSLDAFDQKTFDGLPDWLKEKIRLSPEYAEATGSKSKSDGSLPAHVTDAPPFDDEIGF